MSQHGLLSTDPLLLQQHAQIPVSIAQGNIGIPAGALHLENAHNMSNHQHQNENLSSQNPSQITRDLRVRYLTNFSFTVETKTRSQGISETVRARGSIRLKKTMARLCSVPVLSTETCLDGNL